MDRLTQPQLRRTLLDFVRDCYAPRDRDAFFAHLLRALPTLIASDITGYAEVRLPGQMIRNAIEPADVRFPGDWQSFERHVTTHPCLIHYLQTGDGRAVAISDFLTRRQFHDTALYQEFFSKVYLGKPKIETKKLRKEKGEEKVRHQYYATFRVSRENYYQITELTHARIERELKKYNGR